MMQSIVKTDFLHLAGFDDGAAAAAADDDDDDDDDDDESIYNQLKIN